MGKKRADDKAHTVAEVLPAGGEDPCMAVRLLGYELDGRKSGCGRGGEIGSALFLLSWLGVVRFGC